MMYTVYCFDDATMDDFSVMTGTLADCRAYIADDICPEELYIVAPDGITVVQ